MKRTLTALASGALLLVTACTSGSDGPDTDSGDSGNAADSLGPMAEFMGYSTNNEEFQQQEEMRQQKVEELTAACMKEEGFEYIPNPSSYTAWGGDEDPEATYGSRAFAEKYGYGIIYWESTREVLPEEIEDPNAPIVEAMSESELNAYHEALWGAPEMYHDDAMSSEAAGTSSAEESAAAEPSTAAGDPGSETAVTEAPGTTDPEGSAEPDAEGAGTDAPAEPTAESSAPMMEPMGCSGKAWAEVYPESYQEPDSESSKMWEEMNRRYQELENNPELAAARKAWSGCMADAGYPGLDEPWSAQQGLEEEWAKLNGRSFEDLGDGGYSISDTPEDFTPDAAAVEDFKKREIAQAVVDFDCAKDMTELQRKLQFEMEAAFIEEFGEQLAIERDRQNAYGG